MDEQQKKYFHLFIGYFGLLLIGLAILRHLAILQDTVGYALTMFGYISLCIYVQYADNKIGASTKEKIFFRVGFLAVLTVVAIDLYGLE
ncbi:hypothetical protein [Alkalibacillus almallahensis]|uniref:hypothetical protein n=1 Tax=Alkalibacillus almallahensis TaxID=1379154 RepID=UPI00141FD205|nr:hypothetical protein [Alkalibacillus almallahensis]NIK12582.1 hypothetical protein [Alkalibacillus almallahensis]